MRHSQRELLRTLLRSSGAMMERTMQAHTRAPQLAPRHDQLLRTCPPAARPRAATTTCSSSSSGRAAADEGKPRHTSSAVALRSSTVVHGGALAACVRAPGIDWAARKRKRLLEDLEQACTSQRKRSSGAAAAAALDRPKLEAGLEALEALLPGLEPNVERLPALVWVRLLCVCCVTAVCALQPQTCYAEQQVALQMHRSAWACATG